MLCAASEADKPRLYLSADAILFLSCYTRAKSHTPPRCGAYRSRDMTRDGRLRLDQPAAYRIAVQGELDEEWSDWLSDLVIRVEGGITILSGTVPDQPALHGLLVKIRDLGLPLVSVEYVPGRAPGTDM
jgi:hypothetical protein